VQQGQQFDSNQKFRFFGWNAIPTIYWDQDSDERSHQRVRTIVRSSSTSAVAQSARDAQEKLFKTAVPLDLAVRNCLAIFLHDRYPKTAHPTYDHLRKVPAISELPYISLGGDADRISMALRSERSQSWLLTTISGKSLA